MNWCVAIFPIALAGLAMLPTMLGAEGAKFVGVGEQAEHFKKPFDNGGCYGVSENLSVCARGSDFAREDSVADGRDRLELFYADERRSAAVQTVYFGLRESFDLEPAVFEALIKQHIFENSPRGRRVLDDIISEEQTPFFDRLHRQTSFVVDEAGQKKSLTFTVITLQYGIAFAETTIELEDETVTLEEALSFHREFLAVLKQSVNVGPGY